MLKELHSALEGLAGEDLAFVPDDDLKDTLIGMARMHCRFDAEFTRRVGELDHRDCTAEEGYLSSTSWLRDRCRLLAGRARDLVRWARALRTMPETEAAFRAGHIGDSEVRVLVDAKGRHPEVFARHEPVLVDSARDLGPRDLRHAVDYWLQAADRDAALADANALHARRRLHLSKTFGGMWRLDAEFDPEAGAILATALQAMSEPAALDPKDRRTPGQRRADALVDLAKAALDDGSGLSTRGGNRPHLMLLVDLETLEQRAGRRCETVDGDVLTAETALRLACDANISRVITKGDSMPLDLGRSTRTVTPAQWRALVVRDGGCVHPGCDRPARWCDAHHKMHWIHGGRTDLDDLELRCRPHHIIQHEGAGESPRRE